MRHSGLASVKRAYMVLIRDRFARLALSPILSVQLTGIQSRAFEPHPLPLAEL